MARERVAGKIFLKN